MSLDKERGERIAHRIADELARLQSDGVRINHLYINTDDWEALTGEKPGYCILQIAGVAVYPDGAVCAGDYRTVSDPFCPTCGFPHQLSRMHDMMSWQCPNCLQAWTDKFVAMNGGPRRGQGCYTTLDRSSSVYQYDEAVGF